MDPFAWELIETDHELLGYLPEPMRRALVGRSWECRSPHDELTAARSILALDGQQCPAGRLVASRGVGAINVYPVSSAARALRPFLLTEVRLQQASPGTRVVIREALPQLMIGVTGVFALVIVAAVLWAAGAMLLGTFNDGSDLFAAMCFAVVLGFLTFALASAFHRALAGSLPSARTDVEQALKLRDVEAITG